jgi:lipopolysaccharide export LptBFGC system permease protein LptF
MAVMRYGQPPMAGAWLPNAVFLAALILLVRRTSTPRATNGTLSHQLQA